MNRFLKYSLQSISSFIPFWLSGKFCKLDIYSVFYHVVSNDDLRHIKHLYPYKNISQFKNDLLFLKKNFNIISLHTLINHLENDEKLPEKALILTFDDGLSECYTNICPILSELKLPATFFINSGFIDNKALMYRYKASLLIDYYKDGYNAEITALFKKYNYTFKSATSFLEIIWNNRKLIDECAEIMKINFNEFLEFRKPYLISSQIITMIDEGFTFGAHSVNHPFYYKIPLQDQIFQTLESQKFLIKNFDINYNAFAFPFTDFKVKKELIDKIIYEHKFSCIFGGAGLKLENEKKHIQRIAMEDNLKSCEEIMKFEHLYYFLKSFINKNTIHRV